MIIIKLQGGLGNQMFQYALGRALSLSKKTGLAFDVRTLEHSIIRPYALGAFVLDQNFADKKDVERLARFKRRSGTDISSRLYNFFIARWDKYANEKQFHFDSDIWSVSNDAYIDGYWNTEKYFKDIRPTILADFKVKAPSAGKNKEAAEDIRGSEAVSVHIRRGDYANDPKTNAVHGTLDGTYYSKAFELIGEKVENPQLFVFSDDIGWVRKNISLPFPATYVDWNGDAPFEDIRLMSLCKHHIIANSTFSWWGAWLAENPGKIVVAPARWFNNQKKSTDTKDVLPDSWIKL